MALMLPAIVSVGTRSNAERKLFEKMKHDLSNDWIVIHSLGLASHERKPWAEIDFVLIGPTGVYCLEVKGGRVERREGTWQFIDRHGTISRKPEGPFEQVGSASAALFNYLRDSVKGGFGAVIGYGVCFPDIHFSVTGPDIEPSVVYDQRDGIRPFGEYLRRLGSYWNERVRLSHGRTTDDLHEHKRRAVLNVLRGDFDLRPSIRAKVDSANEELLRLTREQERALGMLRANPRVLVMGRAGSGKTLLAVNEAQRLAHEGNTVLLCCYNKYLASYLRKAVQHENIDVVHLHGYMASVISRAGLWDSMPAAEEDDLFSLFFPLYCLEGLALLGEIGKYDALIMDEAQDFMRDTYIDVLSEVLKKGITDGTWRIFYDPNQNIYRGIGQKQIEMLDRLSGTRVDLQRNCRNTLPVAVFTQLLSGIYFDENAEAEGPEVQQYWYHDDENQRTQVSNCVNRFLSEGIRPSQIALLSPRRRENSALCAGLKGVPYPMRDVEQFLSTSEEAILFSTVSSFKGLEADVVVLVDLDQLSAEELSATVYVGASRSRSLLAVFLGAGMKSLYAERAEDFGEFQKGRNLESEFLTLS